MKKHPQKQNHQSDEKKADSYQSDYFPTWCPGCGNYSMWTALKNAAADMKLNPEKTLMCYGIGCSGNSANVYSSYGFHSLHGRALPIAEGARLANDQIKIIAIGGDGDMYGIGLSHLINAMRRNFDITTIVHNNMIYALTTGQASPTSAKGFISKSTPDGAIEEPINPIALALASNCSFVARTFAGDLASTRKIYQQAIAHKGFSLVDVFQPCVTFNKINTYKWYREHTYQLEEDSKYDPNDKMKAVEKALQHDAFPVGVFYKKVRPSYDDEVPQNTNNPLAKHDISNVSVKKLMEEMV